MRCQKRIANIRFGYQFQLICLCLLLSSCYSNKSNETKPTELSSTVQPSVSPITLVQSTPTITPTTPIIPSQTITPTINSEPQIIDSTNVQNIIVKEIFFVKHTRLCDRINLVS